MSEQDKTLTRYEPTIYGFERHNNNPQYASPWSEKDKTRTRREPTTYGFKRQRPTTTPLRPVGPSLRYIIYKLGKALEIKSRERFFFFRRMRRVQFIILEALFSLMRTKNAWWNIGYTIQPRVERIAYGFEGQRPITTPALSCLLSVISDFQIETHIASAHTSSL